MTRKGLGEFLPPSVQKSYFMLSDAERKVLNSALEKYRPGQSEAILVGGENLLKPALQLMSLYRLRIQEIKDSEAITSSGSAITDLCELPSASVGRRDGGDQ